MVILSRFQYQVLCSHADEVEPKRLDRAILSVENIICNHLLTGSSKTKCNHDQVIINPDLCSKRHSHASCTQRHKVLLRIFLRDISIPSTFGTMYMSYYTPNVRTFILDVTCVTHVHHFWWWIDQNNTRPNNRTLVRPWGRSCVHRRRKLQSAESAEFLQVKGRIRI